MRRGGVASAALASSLDAPQAHAAQSAGWKKSSGKWWYAHSGSGYAVGWEKIGGKWYHFDKSGWMQTGWQKISGKWYYLKSSGAMAEGWQKVSGKWYYLNPGSGKMATGWKQVDGKWYHMDSSGAIQTGWQKLSGKWYYLKSSGAMAEGWTKVSGKWYYLEPGSGKMATGWKQVDGTWYHLQSSGAMDAKKWIGNYYVDGSGKMLTNQWVGQYYVGADGKWIKNYKEPVSSNNNSSAGSSNSGSSTEKKEITNETILGVWKEAEYSIDNGKTWFSSKDGSTMTIRSDGTYVKDSGYEGTWEYTSQTGSTWYYKFDKSYSQYGDLFWGYSGPTLTLWESPLYQFGNGKFVTRYKKVESQSNVGESNDSFVSQSNVIGEWHVIGTKGKNDSNITWGNLPHSTACLQVNSNQTFTLRAGNSSLSGTWEYYETEDEITYYVFTDRSGSIAVVGVSDLGLIMTTSSTSVIYEKVSSVRALSDASMLNNGGEETMLSDVGDLCCFTPNASIVELMAQAKMAAKQL